jgi:hypothetical protein
MGTVTARFGAAFDRTLYYVLGGFAWEHDQINNPGIFAPLAVPFNPEFSGTRAGPQWAPDLNGP